MTPMECQALRDRMPAAVLGKAALTDAERAHLEGCSECREEWRLIEAASDIGRDAAARIDPARLAAGVLARLREDELARGRRFRRWWATGAVAAAAVIALLLWGGPPADPPAHAPRVAEVLPELERLDTAELAGILAELTGPAAAVPTLEGPALDDLTADELERVLETWEN